MPGEGTVVQGREGMGCGEEKRKAKGVRKEMNTEL